MSLLGKQTVIAKCPSCQASTKVVAHPDKPSIRCPRCKTTVPLTFAQKFTEGEHKPPRDTVPPRDADASMDYGSEVPVSHSESSSSRRSKSSKRPSQRSDAPANYPDHSVGFVRYSILFSVLFVVLAVGGIGYLLWRDQSNSRQQEFINNATESIELHQKAITSLRKALDPLEGAEAAKTFREAKGKIEFLAVRRRRMAAPDATDNPAAGTVVADLAKAEKELAQAEEDVKRMTTTQVPVTPQNEAPQIVSPNLGSSITNGPKNTPPPAVVRNNKTVDAQSVTVCLPGITKEMWNEQFVKRFSVLADDGQGKITTQWAGDLLTLEVRPVQDPARYASRVNFGKLIYYSRNDRLITIEFNPDKVNNYTAQGDLLTPILIDLKQREKIPKVSSALAQLTNLKVDPQRQAEVATILETIVIDTKLDTTMREMAIKLVPMWSGKESADLLIRMLEDKSASMRLAAIDALVETKSPLAAAALVKRWDKLDPERIGSGLTALGSDVETEVLPSLVNSKSVAIRVEACRVLGKVGTTQSLKPLLDLINSKDQPDTIVSAAKDAMKMILERKTK